MVRTSRGQPTRPSISVRCARIRLGLQQSELLPKSQ